MSLCGSASADLSVMENSPMGTVLGRFSVSDMDCKSNGAASVRLLGGERGKFGFRRKVK